MKRSLMIVITILVFATAICAGPQPSASGNLAVSTAWLAEHTADANLVLLHVGVERKPYDTAHIAGARYVAMSSLTATRNGVPNQTPAPEEIKRTMEALGVGDKSHVVIYGDGPLLATHVFFLLDYIGHQQHAILDGGLTKWKAEQRATTSAVPEFKSSTLTVTLHPELLVDFAAMQKIVADKKMLVLDGRPADQFSGTTPGEGIKRAGHIPGAINTPWIATIVSEKDPVLKSVDEIRALYSAAGVKAGKKVVTYCRTGLIAKNAYFTMKSAGFSPVVYDGSFLEWSSAADTAVER